MIEVPLSKLCRTALPPELIIDGFIENYPDVGHEDYLTEFINYSSFFWHCLKDKPISIFIRADRAMLNVTAARMRIRLILSDWEQCQPYTQKGTYHSKKSVWLPV